MFTSGSSSKESTGVQTHPALASVRFVNWRKSGCSFLGKLPVKSWLLCTVLVVGLVPTSCGWTCNSDARRDGMELVYVRHAQTLANASNDYSNERQMAFTSKGKLEIRALTRKLKQYSFDTILVSPTWRTLHTIAPYLEAVGQVAEIWPEIDECCYQEDRKSPPTNHLVRRSRRIEIENKIASLFRFRNAESRFWLEPVNYADSTRQVERAHKLLLSRFGGSSKTVLMVAHFRTGDLLLRSLLGDDAPAEIDLENAKITRLRQRPKGNFQLVTYNGKSVHPAD